MIPFAGAERIITACSGPAPYNVRAEYARRVVAEFVRLYNEETDRIVRECIRTELT